MAPSNSDNYQHYLENLHRYNRGDLKPTNDVPTLAQLIAEGNKLLEEEAKIKPIINAFDQKALNKLAGEMMPSKNPYIRARIHILDKWIKNPKTAWKVNEIEKMEMGEIPKNRNYDDFVKEIETLGDSFSS